MAPLTSTSALFLAAVAVVLVYFTYRAEKRDSVYKWTLRNITYVTVPLALVLIGFISVRPDQADSRLTRMLETLLGVQLVWVLLSAVKAYVLRKEAEAGWQLRIPGLFLDLVRLALVLVAAALIVGIVWQRDVGQLFATLGIGSIVLGLALQDTLGNLFSGIALLFERPFNVGDWIRIGDIEGEVVQTNWRAVRLRSRQNALIVVPNGLLGKERIQNLTYFDNRTGVAIYIGFSLEDPPNKVKHVIREVLRGTPGVARDPAPRIRTKGYRDFSVEYEIRFDVCNYAQVLEIQEDIQTRLWYAGRRHGLTIPVPVRTVYKTEMAPRQVRDAAAEVRESLAAVPFFKALTAEERATLAEDAVEVDFAVGEPVVKQGEEGDSLYIIRRGSASVVVQDAHGAARTVARIKAGDVFGEMSLLTGAPRTATVVAAEDLRVLVVYKNALQEHLLRRSELSEQLASIAASRRSELDEYAAQSIAADAQSLENRKADILSRIKGFFRMGDGNS